MTEAEIAAFPDMSLQLENDVALQMSSKDYLLTGSPQVSDICIVGLHVCCFGPMKIRKSSRLFETRDFHSQGCLPPYGDFFRPRTLEMYASVCVTVEALAAPVLLSAIRRCETTTLSSIWKRRRLAGAL